MQTTFVSVIIPLYNAERYIVEALNSVVAQTHRYWECIIVDDGSTDQSGKLAKDFCKQDARFSYHLQANAGASSARNKGIDLAKGDYVQFLDADDFIFPEKITLMLEESLKTGDSTILYSDMRLGQQADIHEAMQLRFSLNLGHDVSFEETYKRYALDFGITPACLFIPRKVTAELRWNTELGPGEDWDYILQVLDRGYVLRFFPHTLVLYRNTEQSYSKNSFKSFNSAYKILFNWACQKKKYFFAFSQRSALIYKRSFFYWLTGKSQEVIRPKFDQKDLGVVMHLYIALIYPLTAFYILGEVKNILVKRTKRFMLPGSPTENPV